MHPKIHCVRVKTAHPASVRHISMSSPCTLPLPAVWTLEYTNVFLSRRNVTNNLLKLSFGADNCPRKRTAILPKNSHRHRVQIGCAAGNTARRGMTFVGYRPGANEVGKVFGSHLSAGQRQQSNRGNQSREGPSGFLRLGLNIPGGFGNLVFWPQSSIPVLICR